MALKTSKKPKQLKKPKAVKPKIKEASTQNSLFYKALFEDGLMEVVDGVFSKTYELGSINYTTAHLDEQKKILSHYNDAINQLSDKDHFQLTIVKTKNPKGNYMKETAYPLQGDELDRLRNEWNQIIEANYDAGRNNYTIERFVTLSTKETNIRNANKRLLSISEAFADELIGVKVPVDELDGMKRLKLCNKILRPGKPLYGDYRDIEKSKRTTKDLIAPLFFEFKQPGRVSFQMDDHYGQVLYLRDFPRNLSDKMFKELTDIESEMVLTIHGSPYSIAKTTKKLRAEATDIEVDVIKREQKASERGHSTEHIARPIKELKSDLDEQIEFVEETGDKQISSTFLVYVWEDSMENLQHQVDKVKDVGEKFGAVFEPLYLVQEQAFNAVLPFGKNYLGFQRIFLRDLITPNISINSPFTNQDVQHKGGQYYGINSLSKNNIVINRMGDELKNANGGIMAVSGGGKSFAAKSEIAARRLKNPNAEIIVLDLEREYIPIGKALGGEIVTVAPGSETAINILELADEKYMQPGDNPVAIKSNFLISLFTNLVENMTSTKRTIIDSVTRDTFREFKNPTLQEWYQVLQRDSRIEAKELVGDLGLYVTGSLNMFAKPTNVNLNNSFTIYDMYLLKNEMTTFGYLAILDRVWNKVAENRAKGIETYVYIDELQVVIKPSQPAVLRNQVSEIYARIRKYKGCPTFMTQSAETMLATMEGRSILFNSDFLMLLEQQKGEVLDALVERFRLTEKQSSYIENSKHGTGLIIAAGQVIPFSNLIPKDTELFKLMDTKYEDQQVS